MTVATLKQVLDVAVADKYAVAGLVVLGWEDARAYVEAAENVGLPVILQAGPGCRKNMPIPVLGKMFRHLAETASVPVVCHIDHAFSIEECVKGIEHGFTSVMIDGSKLPLVENMKLTRRVVEMAHQSGVSVEGEIGVVGYQGGTASTSTSPEEACLFEIETDVDAIAVSVGNVHLNTSQSSNVDFGSMQKVAAATKKPLVLHGGSGIAPETRRILARDCRVAKFNIGTELRMAFGSALRETLQRYPQQFDRVDIFNDAMNHVRAEAQGILAALHN
jgi:fructose-bisphosphate aldolase, class II